jgi:hypothetical protein
MKRSADTSAGGRAGEQRGIFRRERIEDATDEVTDAIIDVNLRAC